MMKKLISTIVAVTFALGAAMPAHAFGKDYSRCEGLDNPSRFNPTELNELQQCVAEVSGKKSGTIGNMIWFNIDGEFIYVEKKEIMGLSRDAIKEVIVTEYVETIVYREMIVERIVEVVPQDLLDATEDGLTLAELEAIARLYGFDLVGFRTDAQIIAEAVANTPIDSTNDNYDDTVDKSTGYDNTHVTGPGYSGAGVTLINDAVDGVHSTSQAAAEAREAGNIFLVHTTRGISDGSGGFLPGQTTYYIVGTNSHVNISQTAYLEVFNAVNSTIANALQDAYDAGYAAGYEEGFNDGYREGYADGFADGVNSVS